ncbi:RNA polymerase sigma-70 factor, ECF subfamily [Ruminococcaceae bacterium FB2012]|nr:RNA polymerase sigma-70 factor, ECF subfamily [Ruminococcaceae bacterium FB2012]
MDDEALIQMFKNRDDRAVSELRSKYERLCFRIAGNFLPSPEDAEECVNTAFFEIWNSIPPEEPADLRAYLCRIVRNQALKKLEYNTAAKRDPAVTVPLDEIADCVPAGGRDPEGEGLAEAVSRFLRTQDALHRRVFVLRYWYGDPLSEIAERCGIREKTAATYLFRMRKKLRVFLKKEGYDYD